MRGEAADMNAIKHHVIPELQVDGRALGVGGEAK